MTKPKTTRPTVISRFFNWAAVRANEARLAEIDKCKRGAKRLLNRAAYLEEMEGDND